MHWQGFFLCILAVPILKRQATSESESWHIRVVVVESAKGKKMLEVLVVHSVLSSSAIVLIGPYFWPHWPF